MLICTINEGVYEGSVLLLNKEIEDKSVEDVAKMAITLAKVDIILAEVRTIRSVVADYAQIYNLLENIEAGNILLNGSTWKSKAFATIKEVFMTIMQSGKLLETYYSHQKVLDNFVRMSKWTDGQEHIGCSWVESYDKHVRVKVKLTKRDQKHLEQRLNIFKTKTELVTKCNENNELGKRKLKFIESREYLSGKECITN